MVGALSLEFKARLWQFSPYGDFLSDAYAGAYAVGLRETLCGSLVQDLVRQMVCGSLMRVLRGALRGSYA